MSANCTVTFDDGRTVHCIVDNLTINTGYDEGELGGDYSVISTVYNQTVEIVGRIIETECEKLINDNKKEYVEENMRQEYNEKSCADEYDNGNSLSRKLRDLELDNEERLLRKHNLVEIDGILTTKGKNFLMNVIFDDYKDAVITALEAIEEVEGEEA